MDKIFVQIASYRDPELVPTIKDCVSKAKYPERLTFGICWQHSEDDEWDNLDEFKEDDKFTILDIPWNESKGLCWARHTIQKMWKGEKYTLQIDSHHRFIQDWDEELINMMNLTGSDKPIITSYAGMYKPDTNQLLNFDPYKMVGKIFTPGGTILFYPESIPNYQQLDKPIPARFVSGHFFFTYGVHCEEYKYDPNIYFAGDEISLSIRSYTLGYDLFHPHKLVIWHEYTREGRTKHWTDFDDKNKKEGKVEKLWWEIDNESKRRLRHMLQEEFHPDIDLGEYGLGTVRTHRDYENYAGIDFSNRVLHPDLVKGLNPPTIRNEDDIIWRTKPLIDYNFDLNWVEDYHKIYTQNISKDDFNFLYIGIEDSNNNVLYRYDANDYDYINGNKKSHFINIKSHNKPIIAVLWPNSKTKGWLSKITISINI